MTKGLPLRGLHRLAKSFGIQRSYRGLGDKRYNASPEALLLTLQSLSVPLHGFRDVPEALRQRQADLARRFIEPVLTSWDRAPLTVEIRIPRPKAPQRVGARLVEESGRERQLSWNLAELDATEELVEGEPYLRLDLRIEELTLGRQRLEVQAGSSHGSAILLSAPSRCWRQESGARRWGLFAPTYALRSESDWGMGDFSELGRLVQLTDRFGGRSVGTLPLLPVFLEEPFDPSPYSPVSRLFWNELFIDPRRTTEWEHAVDARRLTEKSHFRETIARLRSEPLVDYQAQLRVRRPLLESLGRCAQELRGGELARFAANHPRALDYAQFRAAVEERRSVWSRWPGRLRQGTIAPDEVSSERVRYHLYCQLAANEQLASLGASGAAEGPSLLLDLPLGVHRDGYDTWREQAIFARAQSVGAPPDPVFAGGQNWSFPPVIPEASRAQGHRYFRDALRHHLRHAGALRIDHVMGLHRQFWIPEGLPVEEGVYLRYPAEELYAVSSLESHRARAELVGENLGLVGSEVERSLRRHGVRGLYLLPYQLTGYPPPPPKSTPPSSPA